MPGAFKDALDGAITLSARLFLFPALAVVYGRSEMALTATEINKWREEYENELLDRFQSELFLPVLERLTQLLEQ